MNPTPGLYCMNIYTSAFSVTVLGGPELYDIFEHHRDGAYSSARHFSVEGMEDSAERSPILVTLDPECIMAITLTRRN